MTWARVEWALHTSGGRLDVLDGSSWGMDSTWAPVGDGTLQVAAAAWDAAGLDPLARVPMILEARATPYAETGDLSVPFTSAGPGGWPLAPARDYDPSYGPQAATSRRWHVYLRSAELVHATARMRLEVATFELQLVEAVNLAAEPWMPERAASGVYLLGGIALQLFRYLGVPASVAGVGDYLVPEAQIEPWAPGTSAWDWLERLRVKSGYAVRVDPELRSLRYTGRAPIADGSVPLHYPITAHTLQLSGVGEADGLGYADALRLTWRWTDAAGELAESVETALAPDLADWRDARRVAELELPGPPIPGRAAQLITELRRWRSVAFFSWPVGLAVPTLGSGDARYWRSLRYGIAQATTATASVIVNA